jgi:hypothetical protein
MRGRVPKILPNEAEKNSFVYGCEEITLKGTTEII